MPPRLLPLLLLVSLAGCTRTVYVPVPAPAPTQAAQDAKRARARWWIAHNREEREKQALATKQREAEALARIGEWTQQGEALQAQQQAANQALVQPTPAAEPSRAPASSFTTTAPASSAWLSLSSHVRPGVRVYIGHGEQKSYVAQVIEVEDKHRVLEDDGTLEEWRGIKVLYPDGESEWKKRDAWLRWGSVRADDPALSANWNR